MDKEVVLIVRRSVYGEDKFYPANDLADMLCDVSNTKTLPKRVLTTIKDSGLFEIMESLGGIYQVPFTFVNLENPINERLLHCFSCREDGLHKPTS